MNATLLGSDVVAVIEQLKAQPGKDLIKYGNSRLDATLLRAGVVDELRIWIMPVVVGSGQRIFEDIETSSLKLTLTDVHTLRNGSVVLTYTTRLGAVGRDHRSRGDSCEGRPRP